MLTFVSGGVRSGKSSFAERLLVDGALKTGGRLVYIASGRAVDEEMQERIERHKADRAGESWLTIEQPVSLHDVLPFIQEGDFVLWDCLTTWLANEMYEEVEHTYCVHVENCMRDKIERLMETVAAITAKASQFVIVSNEVLDELPSVYEETRMYCEWIGLLHQQLVALADTAIEMDAGMALYWKQDGQVVMR